MSDYEDYDVELQWIFDFECFEYLSKIFIKEFCAYCMQTREYILYYVKTPVTAVVDLHPIHVGTFAIQTYRHGFNLPDGDMDMNEFRRKLTNKVSRNSTIYTTNSKVQKFFQRYSEFHYPNIVNISKLLPFKYKQAMIPLTHMVCERNHSQTDCAKRKVHELARFLRPALIPYLQCSAIKTINDNKEKRPYEVVQYAKHTLHPPFYRSLSTVDLLAACDNETDKESVPVTPVEDCQYSLEG